MSDGILLASRWAGFGEGKVIFNPYRISLLAVQWNREFQQPAALGDTRVRQALLHAIDRGAIVDRIFKRLHGSRPRMAPPAGSGILYLHGGHHSV